MQTRSNEAPVSYQGTPYAPSMSFEEDDEPTVVVPRPAAVPEPVYLRCSDGRIYCCLGAAGGYGATMTEAFTEACRRAPAAERWFAR